VYATGAATNVASALLLEPSILDKLAVFIVGPSLRSDRISLDDYNSQGDPIAMQFLLESQVELHLMPGTTVISAKLMDFVAGLTTSFPENEPPVFKWQLQDAERHLGGRGGIKSYLLGRWQMHAPLNKSLMGGDSPQVERLLKIGRFLDNEWVMWDVALIEASLNPELATSKTLSIAGRSIHVWTGLSNQAMTDDFWNASDAFPDNRTVYDAVPPRCGG